MAAKKTTATAIKQETPRKTGASGTKKSASGRQAAGAKKKVMARKASGPLKTGATTRTGKETPSATKKKVSAEKASGPRKTGATGMKKTAASQQPGTVPQRGTTKKATSSPRKNGATGTTKTSTAEKAGSAKKTSRAKVTAIKADAPRKAGASRAQGRDVAKDALEGKKAPKFALPDQSGKNLRNKDLSGKPYVIYFYPKDDTPGCTKEACGFQDEMKKFKRAGVSVIGVSPDPEKSHQKFAKKYKLSFPLLADTEKTLAEAYGVWKLKKNYGREYWGVERSTFLVGSDGKIKKAWRGVKVPGHVDEVLAAAKALR